MTNSKWLFFVVFLLLTGPSFGQTMTLKPDTSVSAESVLITQKLFRTGLSDREVDERLQTIQRLLQHNEKAASNWWVAWIGIYGGATIGQGVVACLAPDKSTRQDMILGAGTTLLGVVGQFIAPVSSGYDARQFSHLQFLSKEERLERLNLAEAMLKFQADRARSGRNWQTQALGGAVNLTSGLITWLGFKRSVWEGVANFALNTAVSEIQIYSEPVRAIKDYKNYCAGNEEDNQLPASEPRFCWQANVHPGGISLVLNF
ncbi:MAG: hypothetical protein Q8914_05180 [Bacteroidota bacterium]|nr:hypothetical protein [Bacteroidota bacterium]